MFGFKNMDRVGVELCLLFFMFNNHIWGSRGPQLTPKIKIQSESAVRLRRILDGLTYICPPPSCKILDPPLQLVYKYLRKVQVVLNTPRARM